ncbi:lasso peptide biosynthesis B2 protein [Amycolatopsis japonica]|uniref:lasso peptide biosynthesis B2 protein n=1 Tax=Amycolatopsis japonica TaxID=208439 RepID=UPI0037B8E448
MTSSSISKPPLRRRCQAMVAIASARLLAAMSPRRIRSVLGLVYRGARSATHQEILRARMEVVGTSARCAGNFCLQRSIATVLLARMRGAVGTWCVGVRSPPFAAHAWVEAEGRPVGESEEDLDYRPILMVSPPVSSHGE